MFNAKYLRLCRGAPSQGSPSAAQMQGMCAAFNAWKVHFRGNILDMGSQLNPSGKVLTASSVTDGPFAEGKEVVGGFMIIAANDYEGAVAVVKAMPMMQMPGACVEIREMASF